MKPCSIIDAPSDLGLRPTGVDQLPDALRAAGLLQGHPDIHQAGRIPVPPYVPHRDEKTGVLNPDSIARFAADLAARVAFTLDLGRFPLVLGGDCSILLGPTLALRRRGRYGLFFIDGHADYFSPESEPTGEVASMDLALVTGHGPDKLANLAGLRPLVREEDTVVFGFRDAESAAEYGSPDVRQTSMHIFDLDEVRQLGAVAAAQHGLTALEESGVEGFWIHLDADVLNDDVMPAVDYRMPGGLSPNELTEALIAILASPLAIGMELTIYNPMFDDPQRSSARVISEAVTAAFASAQ